MLFWQVAQAGPIVSDEFGVGGTSNAADWCYKLDVIEIQSTTRLISISPWLLYQAGLGADEVYYTLYEETVPDEWALLWDSGPTPVGSLAGFQESPEVDLVLSPGQRYAMGVYLPDGNYEYASEDPATLVDHGWGVLVGAVWSAEDSTFSLPTAITQTPDGHAYLMRVTVEILDVDGDGVLTEDDCDDEDVDAYPGAPELCDGEDNDCTGVADDSEETWYADDDGDGFGDGEDAVVGCTPSEGTWAGNGTDCDDTNPDVHPEADEVPGNLVDEDCDGTAQNEDPPEEEEEPAPEETLTDIDGDGFLAPADCDDQDAAVHPGAAEDLSPQDLDCDGLSDPKDPFLPRCGWQARPSPGSAWVLLVVLLRVRSRKVPTSS